MATWGARIVCLMLVLCWAVPGLATDYTVGDASGWALGVDYSTWPAGKTFNVGDNLVFNYGSGHNVAEVSATDYSACNAANAISTDSNAPTTIALKTAGTHYFICGSVGHCGGGMKVAVPVTSGSAATTPAGSQTPSTTTPPGTSTTTTSPAPPTTVTTPSRTYTDISSSATLSPSVVAVVVTWAALLKFVLS
ncbi:hypothetical protein NMG60_11016756 [Bertholletia excelsa]